MLRGLVVRHRGHQPALRPPSNPRPVRSGRTAIDMRYLAIGDIHGHLTALEALLAAVDPQPDDLVITLGDCVDRGPNSRGVIELLMDWQRRGRLIPLQGNHELIMLDARHCDYELWLQVGGHETLASYTHSSEPGGLDDVPAEHWQFIEHDCRRWYETDDTIFVHAGVDPHLPLEQQNVYDLCWSFFAPNSLRPHFSGKRVVCGHTAQHSGVPYNAGHHVCIDTCIYGGGWLTCLDIASNHIWQADPRGRIRERELPPIASATNKNAR